MNIYVIPGWYPQNGTDLTASFIREQVLALKKRGNEVVVLNIKLFSLREIFSYFKYKNRIWNDNGVITKFYKTLTFVPSRFERLHHKSVSKRYYCIIKKSIKNDRKKLNFMPDIFHSHVGPWCSYFCIYSAKKLKLPIVVTEHYSGLTNGDKNSMKFVRERFVIDNSDVTIFVGENLKNSVLKKTKASGKCIVIPNQISQSFFDYKYQVDNKKETFVFLTACHLVKLKKVENVIEAFHNEFLVNENVSLLIAGDGQERTKLENLVDLYGEKTRIHFLGKYSREKAPEIFSNSNVFVLTSEFETFGIVYIEAMSCGLPCIGTKGQGSDDIINESNGISVEFGNISELSKAMRFIYSSYNKFDSNVIKKYAFDNFSENSVCSKIESVYRDAILSNKSNKNGI